jgi:extradiol dioxygenase family protein
MTMMEYAPASVQNTESVVKNLPFHLSICVADLEVARNFYGNILRLEERRASQTSAHFNFYGCQLTCHHVPGFRAENYQREVDAENVPVPHFGVALPYEQFEQVKERLIANEAKFLLEPHIRFVDKLHEQYVMFIQDPSGHGIEIKSFTRVPVGSWI